MEVVRPHERVAVGGVRSAAAVDRGPRPHFDPVFAIVVVRAHPLRLVAARPDHVTRREHVGAQVQRERLRRQRPAYECGVLWCARGRTSRMCRQSERAQVVDQIAGRRVEPRVRERHALYVVGQIVLVVVSRREEMQPVVGRP